MVSGLVVAASLWVVIWNFGDRVDASSAWLDNVQAQGMLANLGPVVGDQLARGLVTLSSYLSQGFYGLSLALHLPWEPSGGLGAFRAVSSYLPQYLGLPDPFFGTYLVRVEQTFGWSSTETWSTIFPWYASDVSFPGVVLLAMLFGWFLGRVWVSFLRRPNGLTLAMIVICAITVIYSPANNQLFNDRFAAFGTVSLLSIYALRSLGRILGA